MVRQKYSPDITEAGQRRTRESVERRAIAEVDALRGLARQTEDAMDEIPGCRANGTCGRCVKFLQGGEGGPTLCARKLRVGRSGTRNGRNIRILEVDSGT